MKYRRFTGAGQVALKMKDRDIDLRLLGFQSYEEYLRSKLWDDRRIAYESKYPMRCYFCGNPECFLHHNSYSRIGKELDEDLTWLCRYCHDWLHKESGHMVASNALKLFHEIHEVK